MSTSLPHARRLFSASRVLGSRVGSVGVGVAGCPGAAWVWSSRCRTAPVSLALAGPAWFGGVLPMTALERVRAAAPGVRVSWRVHRGRSLLRVRGSAADLRAVAGAWAASYWGAGPAVGPGRGS